MAGLLDMLLGGAQANPSTGSQPAPQNGPDMSTLQAASPWGNGTNFNTGTPANLLFTSGQQVQQPSFMQLLQSLMGVKQPSSSGEQLENPNFNNAPYVPSQEQAARMAQLTSTFPQSRNVVDLRQTPQFYPQTGLPLQQMGWEIQGALQQNPTWPRPNPGPQQRFGPQ